MPRFEAYGQSDSQDTTGGDDRWIGINNTLDKPSLQPGYLSRGENTRLRNGRVRQRKGTFMPGDFNPTAGFGNTLIGSGVYRNPNGDEVLLVAPLGTGYTWHVAYGKDPVKISYSSTTNAATTQNNGTGSVEFVQAFDKVLLLRSPALNNENIVWNGKNVIAGDDEWQKTTLSSTGLTLIPAKFNGEPFMDRVIFYNANKPSVTNRDEWLASDIEDYTSYDPALSVKRTNPGEADFITRIMSYFKSSLVIFKNQSIHLAEVQNIFPLLVSQRIINRTIGGIGNKMPLMIGSDVLFASAPQGFYSLGQVIQDNITTLPVPISEPIQATIDDINWGITVQMGCSVAIDNYAFFGVALGRGATRLNAILVFDSQAQQWVSAPDKWTDETFAFNALHTTNYDGVQRVFAIDYVAGSIFLLYEGIVDEMPSGTFDIPMVMETRGYVGDDPLRFKRFGRATVGMATYNPSVNVTALTDGFNEEKLLTVTPITKDRTEFYQHGHARFNVLTDDPTEQKRKDYSIEQSDNFVGDDFEDLAEGSITFIPPSSPPVAGPLQETVEPLLVRSWGRWAALRIENSQGICEVTACGIESTHGINTNRTLA